MKTYKCIICKQLLLFEMFYKNKSKRQGRNSECKKCSSKASLRRYYAHRKTILPQIHKYYQDNKEKCKATGKAYHLKHRARRLEYFKQENPLTRQCRRKLNYEIESGKLERGTCCEDCKTTEERIVGHHENYNKPLEVTWLCQSCHMRRHSILSISPVSKNKEGKI